MFARGQTRAARRVTWLNRACLGCLLCLLGEPEASFGAKVAVLRFQTVDVDSSIALYMGDMITQILQENGQEIVPRKQQEKVLVQEKDCAETGCAAAAGQKLGVDLVVVGKIYKLFGNFSLHVQLVDSKAALNLKSIDKAMTGSLESARQTAQEIAREVMAGLAHSSSGSPLPVDSSTSALPVGSGTASVIPSVAPVGATSSIPPPTPAPTPALPPPAQLTGAVSATPAAPLGMVWVPAGEFILGSGTTGGTPEQRVFLNEFFIQTYEVTNREYGLFVKQLAYTPPVNTITPEFTVWKGVVYPPELEKHPVVNVSWKDADAYCKWIGGRLPTEAEWEKAARGTTGAIYPWGNEWAKERCNGDGDGDTFEQTAPVGTMASGVSAFGAYDMCGNVAEWVADWFDKAYYLNAPMLNPVGPESGNSKVFRGGAFTDPPDKLKAYRRQGVYPSFKDYNIGFRCVKDVR